MSDLFQMKGIFLYFLLKLLVHRGLAESANEDLKEEIQAVATESRSLADELAEMLLRLEVQDLREEAVESAVIGDNEKVQSVLKEMVARMHKLEEASEAGNYEKRDENKDYDGNIQNEIVATIQPFDVSIEDEYVDSIDENFLKQDDNKHDESRPQKNLEEETEKKKEVENKDTKDDVQLVIEDMFDKINNIDNISVGGTHSIKDNDEGTLIKEERLRSSLDNLEKVAQEIEKLAFSANSEDEIKSVNQLTKVLEAMTSKLSVDEVKISVDVKLGKVERINNIEENIENMLDSLLEVVGQMKNLKSNAGIKQSEPSIQKSNESDKLKNLKSGKSIKVDEEERTTNHDPIQEHEGLRDDKNIPQKEENLFSDIKKDNQTKVILNKLKAKDPIVIRRKPKQLDDGLISDEDVETTTVEMPNINEDCREATKTSRVKICVPAFAVHKKRAKFFSKTIKEAKHCYEV